MLQKKVGKQQPCGNSNSVTLDWELYMPLLGHAVLVLILLLVLQCNWQQHLMKLTAIGYCKVWLQFYQTPTWSVCHSAHQTWRICFEVRIDWVVNINFTASGNYKLRVTFGKCKISICGPLYLLGKKMTISV